MIVELTNERFFGAGGVRDIEPVLTKCLSAGLELQVALCAEGAWISASPPAPGGDYSVAIHGRWRSQLLEGRYEHPGALLIAPFLFTFKEVRFPSRSLYTLGRGTKSVADLCMRNFFFAAVRGEAIQFRADKEPATATRMSGELSRAYLWVAKEYLREDILTRANATELILAGAHVPIPAFSSPLMTAGVAEFQKAAAHAHQSAELRAAFHRIRERMMAFYEA